MVVRVATVCRRTRPRWVLHGSERKRSSEAGGGMHTHAGNGAQLRMEVDPCEACGKIRLSHKDLPHLERVVGVGTLSARGLAGGDAQRLGRHAHGALDLEVLVLGALDQVSAHCGGKCR